MMAGADYYSCDVCGCKTFYDAQLHWPDNHEDAYFEDVTNGHSQMPVGAGAMRVLCRKCIETYEITVTPKTNPPSTGSEE